MNHKLFGSLVTVLSLLAILPVSFPIVWSEKDYCYDQVVRAISVLKPKKIVLMSRNKII
jgi:hypothetical protein